MSDRIKMSGFVSAECEARTLGDLRALVKWCDEYKVDDKAGLDWGAGKLYVELTGDNALPAEWIECGEHVPPSVGYHLIIDTHYHGPETYEEAREEALEKKKPARFDWPARDRYGSEGMPG